MAAYGGMEQHVCLLAERCAASGLSTTLLSTSNSLHPQRRARLRSYGVDFREMQCERGKASNTRKMIWLLSCWMQLRRQGWKVAYTNGQSGLAPMAWRIAGKRAAIIHHHHTAADRGERQTWNRQYQSVLATCDRLIACSKTSRQELSDGTGRNDVEFLPYLTPAIVDADDVRDGSFAGKTQVRFGFFGRLVSTKGIDSICQLSREPRFANVVWEIFGKGELYPTEFFASYPNIIYRGEYRDLHHYASVLGGLDATILLSRHNEGMPLSLIEAMSAGLAWVATDQGGTRELSGQSENVELIPKDATYPAICEQVDRMVRRVENQQTSRKAQRKTYDLFLSPNPTAAMWLSLLGASGAWDPRRES